MRKAHVVALTTLYWKGIEDVAASAGFAQYLHKPATLDELMRVLTNLSSLNESVALVLDCIE